MLLTLLQSFCPRCLRSTQPNSCISVRDNDPRVCALQVQCARTSQTLRCLDLSSPGKPCGTATCQITCLACGKAVVSCDEPDFAGLCGLEPAALVRNGAVVTAKWPRNAIHGACCRSAKRPVARALIAMSAEPGTTAKANAEPAKKMGTAMPSWRDRVADEPAKIVTADETPKQQAGLQWTGMMGRMQEAGKLKPAKKAAPVKRAIAKKQTEPAKKPAEPAKKPATEQKTAEKRQWRPQVKPGAFDIGVHGYWRIKGALVYRTPDGRQLPSEGVDAFGPF